MAELTASALNKQIVQMRTTVGQARFRLSSRLIRSARLLKQSKKDANKMGRKVERLLEEVKALKRIKPDDVTKFALLNLKTLKDLNIRGNTPAPERALFKLATEDVVVESVNEFRKSHPNWHQEVPFVLQRLGLQYRGKKKEAKQRLVHSGGETSENSSDGEEANESDKDLRIETEQPVETEPPVISSLKKRPPPSVKKSSDQLVSKLVAGQIKKVARKEKKEGLKNKKKGEPRALPPPPPLPESKALLTHAIKRGEGEIRRFALDREEQEEEEHSGDEEHSGIPTQSNIAPSSSFFLGGKDDDEDQMSDASDNANEQTSSGTKLKSMFTSSLTGSGSQQKMTSVQNRADRRNPMRKGREQQSSDKQQWRSKGASSFTQRPNQQQEGPLHPSWEAKRKMKEKLELTKGAKPQGKKIRFDED